MTKKTGLISLPVFWQVLGLSLAVLILAVVINTAIVLWAPEPPPSGYSLDEAVQTLKTGEVRLQNGRRLKAVTTRTEPSPLADGNAGPKRDTFARQIGQRLALALGVPSDTVTVQLPSRHHFISHMSGPMSEGPPDGGRFHTEIRGDDMRLNAPEPGGRISGPGPGSPQGQGFGPEPGRGLSPGSGPWLETRTDIVYPPFRAVWKLKDGTYRVINPPQDLIAPWQARLLIGFGLTALLILPLAWWLSQRLSRPIIAFSDAAAKIGVEDNAPPVLAVGPREVRQAADVLNAMQTRIRKQVEGRTALMGAIAHDLKTPLARMRLRIEDLPSPLRDKLSGDIAHMDDLIRSAMSFTSAHKLGETLRPLDLSALVEALCDDLAAVCKIEPALVEHNVMVRGDAVAIKRILTNLVENAGRYASGCGIALSTRGPMVEISVNDNGPGLPADMLETVFEPFYRMESSRNRDTGGSGLGLSVARSLAEAQGGSLTLHNRYAGKTVVGLEARLTLSRLVRKA